LKPFCLPPKKVVEFRQALKNRDLDIFELMKMDSVKRTEILRNYAGDVAPQVNLLFEQKLILKNKIKGIENWAKKVGEVGRYSPKGKEAFAKKKAEYAEKQRERIFSPKEDEAFLNDLADSKFGTHITREEAAAVFELSSKVDELKVNFNENTQTWDSKANRFKYGLAKVAEKKYIEGLTNEYRSIPEMVKGRYREAKQTWKEYPVKAVTDLIKDTLNELQDITISTVAAIDNSFMGRQGLVTLVTHPTIWAKAAGKSFVDIVKVLVDKHGREKAIDSLMAEVYSDPNYMNGSYDLAKLIPKAEEQFPTSHPGRVPVIGRAFRASEVAFINSAVRMRTETFSAIAKVAKRNGVDVLDKVWIEDVGKVVNSATARGSFGKYEHAQGLARLVLWAPKMLKGNWDVLTAHTLGSGLKTAYARKIAATNIIKIVSSTAAVAAILNALYPGSVETNPLSSDFMKFKMGDTRFDLTAGKGSLVTLVARAITFRAKSTSTGEIYKLNKGKFTRNLFDVGIDFLVNKTTPFTRTIIDIARGENFKGKKPTPESVAYGLTTPISIQNFVENFYGEDKDGSVAAVLASILDVFGFNAQTYAQNKENLDKLDSFDDFDDFEEE
jgi:hypothetical protein